MAAQLPLDLKFRTKGQLAIDICASACADGISFDFTCGDEVYGSCTQLREFFEDNDQAYVLRVPSNFTLALAAGTKMTCAEAVKALVKHPRRWEVRSAGNGSKGERWYAWAWIATASLRHHLLVRRHIKTGELAFHYCYVPEGQVLTKTRLIRAAGLRWPVEEDFEFSKDCFGLDQCQARLYTALIRHVVLVMAAFHGLQPIWRVAAGPTLFSLNIDKPAQNTFCAQSATNPLRSAAPACRSTTRRRPPIPTIWSSSRSSDENCSALTPSTHTLGAARTA